MTDGAHDHAELTAATAAIASLTTRVMVLERPVLPPPIVVPPPVIIPPPVVIGGVGSAWVDTKDNIQVRQNGNGNVAFQLRKRGTGPITGIRVQSRYGTSAEVYNKGDGGKYAVAAVLGDPDGAPIAGTTWLPGTGNADAHFPTITFDAPSVDVPDGTRFWVRFLNVHTSPDANYLSLNVLHTYGTDPSPRQPLFPDSDLAVLVNKGAGWSDRAQTPNVDVLPNHEGFGYTQCLTGYWKPIGGSNQVRETFTTAGLTFSRIGVRLRGDVSRSVTYTLESSAGAPVVSGPVSGIPASAPGNDNGGQVIGWLVVPATTVPAGTYRLRLSAPSGATYTAAPARKPLKGSYPSLTVDWGSFTCPGFAEFSTDAGASWTTMYGTPNQTDLQFAIL